MFKTEGKPIQFIHSSMRNPHNNNDNKRCTIHNFLQINSTQISKHAMNRIFFRINFIKQTETDHMHTQSYQKIHSSPKPMCFFGILHKGEEGN